MIVAIIQIIATGSCQPIVGGLALFAGTVWPATIDVGETWSFIMWPIFRKSRLTDPSKLP